MKIPNSFVQTLAKLESQVKKLNVLLSNTKFMYENGNIELAYEIAMRMADVAERTVLLARALPAYTGNPLAGSEIQNLIDVSIRIEIGFTEQGWFTIRIPLLLPKKRMARPTMSVPFFTRRCKDFSTIRNLSGMGAAC